MKVFITGSTGFVGKPLSLKLADQGHEITALYRPKSNSKTPTHPNISYAEGNILDQDSLRQGINGCDTVLHVAAYARMYEKEPGIFTKVNVEGTRNVCEAAVAERINTIVFVSTAGVMPPSENGELVSEREHDGELPSAYEKSKLVAEKVVLEYEKKGIKVVIVNPSRIYGPGPLIESNSVTRLFKMYDEGKWRFIPGDGKSIGNYVYVDDVVDGIIAAAKDGRSGERYILSGSNINYLQLFELLQQCTGRRHKLYKVPVPVLMTFAYLQIAYAKFTKNDPKIVPAFVKKLNKNWALSSGKAQEHFGYSYTSIEEGMKRTLNWLDGQ